MGVRNGLHSWEDSEARVQLAPGREEKRWEEGVHRIVSKRHV